MEPFHVEITVKSIKGTCHFGHKVGDKIYFDGRKIGGEVCYNALLTLLPRVWATRFGAQFPWTKDRDVLVSACPDSVNAVVFEIRRIRK